MIEEIATGRATCSRGRSNPRGVRRKMSSYPLRTRGQALHQRLNIRISFI
jgi:hypothetical protein